MDRDEFEVLSKRSTQETNKFEKLGQYNARGFTGDYTNSLSAPLLAISLFEDQKESGNAEIANTTFERIKQGLKSTPLYSEKYLNDTELQKARDLGVSKEDLINPQTQPIIDKLDQIALRYRQIGEEITQNNCLQFKEELLKLKTEGRQLITGR